MPVPEPPTDVTEMELVRTKQHWPPHGRKAHRTQGERDALGAEILRHRINGYTFHEIAKKMNLAVSVAHRLYGAYMADYHALYLNHGRILLCQFNAQMERILSLQLAHYRHSQAEARKKDPEAMGDPAILEEVRATVCGHFDRLMAAGVIPKATEKVNASVNEVVRYKRPEELIDEILRLEEERKKRKAGTAVGA